MKRKQRLIFRSATAFIVILFCICLSLPLRAQINNDYLKPIDGDTLLYLMPASSINVGFGYEKGLTTSYRIIGDKYLLEGGFAYNPVFHDKFLGLMLNLAMMPFSTRFESGLFYSSSFLFNLLPIQTENRVSIMSLNIGWLSQFQKGLCYSISAGPGLKLAGPPHDDVKTSFTINAEVSVGYSF